MHHCFVWVPLPLEAVLIIFTIIFGELQVPTSGIAELPSRNRNQDQPLDFQYWLNTRITSIYCNFHISHLHKLGKPIHIVWFRFLVMLKPQSLPQVYLLRLQSKEVGSVITSPQFGA